MLPLRGTVDDLGERCAQVRQVMLAFDERATRLTHLSTAFRRRVGKSDTAFSYRDANWAEVIVGVDPDPANNPKIISWTKEYWDALHPYSAGGAYVNMMMDEGEDRIKASYRENCTRLAAIKKKYDPTNFFRVNQNIRPA